MHFEEHNPAHFHWTLVDNADQSVFAFEREVGDSDLLFVFNMTPNYYEHYDVGVMNEGEYYELFNSDKDVYGGWNQYNGLSSVSSIGGPENRPYHVSIKLGSYAALIMKRIVKKDEGKSTTEKIVSSKKKTSKRK